MQHLNISRHQGARFPESMADVRGFEVRTRDGDEKIGKVDDIVCSADGPMRYLASTIDDDYASSVRSSFSGGAAAGAAAGSSRLSNDDLYDQGRFYADRGGDAARSARLVLSEEQLEVGKQQVVVEKRAVATEEVVLDKRAVTENQTVEADLRRERVDESGLQSSGTTGARTTASSTTQPEFSSAHVAGGDCLNSEGPPLSILLIAGPSTAGALASARQPDSGARGPADVAPTG